MKYLTSFMTTNTVYITPAIEFYRDKGVAGTEYNFVFSWGIWSFELCLY